MAKGIKRAIRKAQLRRPPARLPAEDDAGDFQDFSKLHNNYKVRRQAFCREYIKDFNGSAAIRRMGYKSQQPGIRASEFLKEPYTQHFLSELMDKADEKAIVSRNRVLFGLIRESNHVGFDGSAAARISALRSLAKILGMEITKVEGNMTIAGGVMAVPMAGSLEEWERMSKEAQAKLKTDVRV